MAAYPEWLDSLTYMTNELWGQGSALLKILSATKDSCQPGCSNMNKCNNQIRRRKPQRLAGYDYSLSGYYFVTICTKSKMEHFGTILDGKMILSSVGKVVDKIWISIPDYYENVTIDEYIVMPNHIHGIVVIDGVESGTGHFPVPTNQRYGLLSKIINSFKFVVSKELRRNRMCPNFGWHRSYHDHIIRNEESLHAIRQYIQSNPLKWQLDRYYRN